ncbi:MAG: gas vesicle protein GvpO [Pseudomonadota bacterium]
MDPIPLIEALSRARASIAELSGFPIDGITASEADGAGGWTVTVEVVESAARMGENDLLSAFQVRIAHDGALAGFSRLRRYRREARDSG